MPTYEYACTDCGQHVEAVQSFTADPLTECPHCGGALRKVFAAPGIVLKGSGFYKTDSRAVGATSSGNGTGDSEGKDRKEGSSSGGSEGTGGGPASDGASSSGGGDGKATPAATGGEKTPGSGSGPKKEAAASS